MAESEACVTPQAMIERLEKLRDDMRELGAAMDYYGGLNAEIVQHGAELVGAAAVVETWIEGMRG